MRESSPLKTAPPISIVARFLSHYLSNFENIQAWTKVFYERIKQFGIIFIVFGHYGLYTKIYILLNFETPCS
jgi:hypothetical protein